VAASGVRRVVASIVDPNPLVNGRGLARLRAAGVAVELGLAAPEAEKLNAPFLTWHRLGRPLVTLKAAASLDGRIAAAGGSAAWITGAPARRFAHRLRLRHDAVLVGAGTIRRDDPRLTVRLRGERAARVRAVIAPALDLDARARIFAEDAGDGSPRPRVYGCADAPDAAGRELARHATVVRVRRGPQAGSIDLGEVLHDLARVGVQSVLVEGGGRTLAAFLVAALADRIALFTAPKLLGDDAATALLDGLRSEDPQSSWGVEDVRRFPLGRDELLMGRLAAPPARG
jgi:diaminohydroxyphosphoribosylaminopyrimidine deaminase/5-amino-6-(5-phosphoribosylamino)uracil reductase